MTRRKLPDERRGLTHRAVIGGHKVYLTTGEFEDGTLGEIFISVDKQGGALRVYDALAIAISIGLQHGVPLEDYVDKLRGMQFEPAGVTGDAEIPMAKSIPDFVARYLELRYTTKGENNV